MRTRDKVVYSVGWTLLALTAIGCVYGRVAFSPDGKRIATVVYGDWPDTADIDEKAKKDPPYELWVTDLATWEHRLVVRDRFVGVSPAWSPDGRELWFLRGAGAKKKPALARWDGGAVVDVAPTSIDGDPSVFLTSPPQPLPDGRSVIFTRGDEADKESGRIVRLDIETGRETVLAEPAGGAALSPKGDRIVFLAWEKGRQRPLSLCVMSAGGGERRTIAAVEEKLKDIGMSPLAWSPDGKLVAWIDATGGKPSADHMSVYVADVETGARRFVSRPQASCILPVFSSGSDAVFYAAVAKEGDMPRTQRADLATGTVAEVPGGEGCVPAGVSQDRRYLALRRMAGSKHDDLTDQQTVVRLVTLATGEFHDDWVTARQRRAFAAAEVIAAEELAKKIGEALKRADEQIDEMTKQFPGADERPEVAEIRRRIAALRPSNRDGAK